MRHIATILTGLALVLAGTALADEPAGTPWFDMENCTMCKPLAEKPELMHHMTWEHYKVSNGIVSVTTVDSEYMDKFRECNQTMGAVAAKLRAGEKLPLCNMCMAYGELVHKGAKLEQVETRRGMLSLMTSDNPELVAEIHAWADRTNQEMAKMMTGMEHQAMED